MRESVESNAAGEVAAGDLAGHSTDPLQRTQLDPDDQPAQRDQGQDHAASDQHLDHNQPVQRVLGLAQWHGHDGRVRALSDGDRTVTRLIGAGGVNGEHVRPLTELGGRQLGGQSRRRR